MSNNDLVTYDEDIVNTVYWVLLVGGVLYTLIGMFLFARARKEKIISARMPLVVLLGDFFSMTYLIQTILAVSCAVVCCFVCMFLYCVCCLVPAATVTASPSPISVCVSSLAVSLCLSLSLTVSHCLSLSLTRSSGMKISLASSYFGVL
jgi:hypothetical protein